MQIVGQNITKRPMWTTWLQSAKIIRNNCNENNGCYIGSIPVNVFTARRTREITETQKKDSIRGSSTVHPHLFLALRSRVEALEILLDMSLEVLLGVCERTEEWSRRTQGRWSTRRIRERRRDKGRLRVIVDGLKRGMEMGAIVVIAVDNMVVVMARNMVLIRAITVVVLLVVIVVACIDIIARASSAEIIGTTRWETATAVMLSRAIRTLIKRRRRKCGGAHMRLRCLVFGILVGRNSFVMLLRSIVIIIIIRIWEIGRRGRAKVAGAFNRVAIGHVNLIVMRTLI